MKKKKVILDFDNTMGLPKHEIDDGLTLLYLLSQDDIEILGITTTYGNGNMEEVMTATQELIAFYGTPIPFMKERMNEETVKRQRHNSLLRRYRPFQKKYQL